MVVRVNNPAQERQGSRQSGRKPKTGYEPRSKGDSSVLVRWFQSKDYTKKSIDSRLDLVANKNEYAFPCLPRYDHTNSFTG